MTDTIQQIAKEMRDAAGDFEPWGRDVIEVFADRLEALQADAREKGEAFSRLREYLADLSYPDGSDPLDDLAALATQPAQASEKE